MHVENKDTLKSWNWTWIIGIYGLIPAVISLFSIFFLGVDVGAGEKIVARLACAGGTNVAQNRARYQGLQSCQAVLQS